MKKSNYPEGFNHVAYRYLKDGDYENAGKYFNASIADYESLLRNIHYKWNQADCQERLRNHLLGDD